MPFEIVRNDITKMDVDAIVNTANPRPVIGAGADAAIHTAAGPELLEARKAIGDIAVGTAAVTPAFDLNARYVIHTVGPVWEGGDCGEAEALASCYRSALAKAVELSCESIAFPLISTGTYGFPKDLALQIAIREFTEFLMEHDMLIYQVVFSREAFRLSEGLFASVQSFIDDNYIDEQREAQEEFFEGNYEKSARQAQREERFHLNAFRPKENALYEPDEAMFDTMEVGALPPLMAPSMGSAPAGSAPAAKPRDLGDILKDLDAGFAETLLKLIDATGEKDSTIYKKANVTKQTFNKIKNNPGYNTSRQTAVAFALALELDQEETDDLLRRAGFALGYSSKFDLIIRWAIENREYNVIKVNCVLASYDQSLLGAA